MKNWLPLFITLTIQAMVAMALLTVPVMATEVALTLGITPALVGIYVAVVYVGAMVASLAAGTAVKRWGAIRVSQLGLLLCAAGLAMCMLPYLPTMAAGAFFIGLGYGPITPASSHLLAKTTRQQHMSLVFSVKQTGVPLGGVLAGAIVPSLAVHVGWQSALAWVAAACIGCIALAQPLRRSLDDDHDPGQPLGFGNLAHPIRLVLQYPALRRLAACSFIFSLVQLSLTTYLATYLNLALGYTLVAAGIALSFTQVGGMVGRVLWGAVADRWTGALPMLGGVVRSHGGCGTGNGSLEPKPCFLGHPASAGDLRHDGHWLEWRIPCRSRAPGAAWPGGGGHRRRAGHHFPGRGAGAAHFWRHRAAHGQLRRWLCSACSAYLAVRIVSFEKTNRSSRHPGFMTRPLIASLQSVNPRKPDARPQLFVCAQKRLPDVAEI